MSRTRVSAQTKRELIIETWERLDCESVGAKELQEIQRVIGERFGEGAIESPASIARTLADEGAVLRHPEVLDCDARWREIKLNDSLVPEAMTFAGLKEAAESIRELERLRQKLKQDSDNSGLARLRQSILNVRQDLALITNSEALDNRTRAEANEIAEWLRVWLNSPELFADWLELRRLSTDFRQRFSL